MQAQTSNGLQISGMPLQLNRPSMHSSTPFMHSQAPGHGQQQAVHASSAFMGAFAIPAQPVPSADGKMVDPSPVTQLDSLSDGLGSLDLPDVYMENLDVLDFDPTDCLF